MIKAHGLSPISQGHPFTPNSEPARGHEEDKLHRFLSNGLSRCNPQQYENFIDPRQGTARNQEQSFQTADK